MNNTLYVPTIYAVYAALQALIEVKGRVPFTIAEIREAGGIHDNPFELVEVLNVLRAAGDIEITNVETYPLVVYKDADPAKIDTIEKLEAWVAIFEDFNNTYGKLGAVINYMRNAMPFAATTMEIFYGEVFELERAHTEARALTHDIKIRRDALTDAIVRGITILTPTLPEGVTPEKLINLVK